MPRELKDNDPFPFGIHKGKTCTDGGCGSACVPAAPRTYTLADVEAAFRGGRASMIGNALVTGDELWADYAKRPEGKK